MLQRNQIDEVKLEFELKTSENRMGASRCVIAMYVREDGEEG